MGENGLLAHGRVVLRPRRRGGKYARRSVGQSMAQIQDRVHRLYWLVYLLSYPGHVER